MAQTAADGLRSVHLGIGPNGDVLNARGINVGRHVAAEEVDFGGGTVLVSELDILQSIGVGHEAGLDLGGGGNSVLVSTGLGPLGAGGLLHGGLGAKDGG